MSSHEDRSDLAFQIDAARLRMLFDHMSLAILGASGFAVLVVWLIRDRVDPNVLWPWLALKLLITVPRLAQVSWYEQKGVHSPRSWRFTYRLKLTMLAVDGLLWGGMCWMLTPVTQLDMVAITLSSVMGVASIGVFMLALDVRTMLAFVLPIILPNALVCLTRQDSLGVFAAVSLSSFLVIATLGSMQAQQRVRELLRLRFDSERVAKERALALETSRQHSEAKTRFLATISHEMRTPLHGILGLVRVLQQEQPRPDQRQRLTLLERSGEHLLTVINDILDFSKIEAGRMEIDARPFDMGELLHEASGVFQVLAQRKGLTFTLNLSWSGPCEVMGDPNRVRQVLHNLLGNAIKFTDQGSVHLVVRRLDGGEVYELTVRDTGKGIAPGEHEQIFEAFTQSHDPLERRQGGTGLGLSIARQLCRTMGGDLVCDSAPGLGSVFKATLRCPPLHGEAQALFNLDPSSVDAVDTSPPDSGWWSAAGAQVLLVEDNPVNIVVAEAVLHNLGCHVSTVTDGLQAVEWLEARQCDVVLMDCAMPVMDGLEACREIRRREQFEGRSRVPIVALTAHVAETERDQCLQAGMDDYLVKPFAPDDVQRVILRVLGNAPILRSL
ncbi:MAG TPA: response regulator [Aquabacterium sp.]|uniref:response regulator n=1 Tax=Aquabacterium sp. TaxID=1872578 RepID=UPI002E3167C5|nr:response regulator [Aquabacterium sp.]HEX5373015.1 response regulator [Aquabacterium sp.]